MGKLSRPVQRFLGFATADDALSLFPAAWNITMGQWPTWLEQNPDQNAPPWRAWGGDQLLFEGDSKGEMEAFILGMATALKLGSPRAE